MYYFFLKKFYCCIIPEFMFIMLGSIMPEFMFIMLGSIMPEFMFIMLGSMAELFMVMVRLGSIPGAPAVAVIVIPMLGSPVISMLDSSITIWRLPPSVTGFLVAKL